MEHEFEQKLDDTLEYLKDKGVIYYNDPINIPNTEGNRIHILRNKLNLVEPEFIELLEVLEEDKMIKVKWMLVNDPAIKDNKVSLEWCVIKYKGKIFIRQGGYVEKVKRMGLEKNQSTRNEADIRLLTFVLAVGAGIASIYYLMEIARFLHSHFSH